jgi:hypothetical protein
MKSKAVKKRNEISEDHISTNAANLGDGAAPYSWDSTGLQSSWSTSLWTAIPYPSLF